MKHSSTAQTMRHLRVEVMELCEGAGLYQIDLLNGSKERVSEACLLYTSSWIYLPPRPARFWR